MPIVAIRTRQLVNFVIPAEAGIQRPGMVEVPETLDYRFRGNDSNLNCIEKDYVQ